MYIAAIPIDQQKGALEAQHEWAVSKAENAKAEADFNESTTQLGVARNDLKATKLAVDSAISTKKSAEQSADTNRINAAQRDLHTAEDLSKAAEARVKYLYTYRNYLKRYWRYTQENMYWHEAQYEAAKGQLAKQHNIAPNNVQYDWFPKQAEERQKRTQSSREKAEDDKQHTVSVRADWLKIQDQGDKENGHQSALWDPMAPAAAPGGGNVETKPMEPVHQTPPSENGGGGGGNAAPQ